MLPKILLSIAFICLCAFNFANGQDIYFCSNYAADGSPVGANKTWHLGENGGYVYILFSSHKKRIKSKSLIVNIMQKSGNTYRNYETKTMDLQTVKTWAVLDYQFTESGTYKFTVIDSKGKDLATESVVIILDKGRITENTNGAEDQKAGIDSKSISDPDRSYYKAKIIFYRSGINSNPDDTGSVFRAGELNITVINDRPLASDTMIVDVFKKGYETEKYPIYVTSKNFWIDGSQNKASFTINLDQTGEYKIITYNRRSQTISEAYVTIR